MSSSFQQNVTAVVDALFPSSSSSSSSASNKKQMRPKIQPLPRDQRRTTTTSSEDYDEEQDNDNDNDNDNTIDYGSFDSDCLTSWIYSSSVFDTKNITPSSSSSSSICDENEFFGTKTTTTFAAQTYALHRNGNSNNNSDSDSEGNLIMIKQTMRQSALGNNNNSNNNNSVSQRHLTPNIKCSNCTQEIESGARRLWTTDALAPKGEYSFKCSQCENSNYILCERCWDKRMNGEEIHLVHANFEHLPPIESRHNTSTRAFGRGPWGNFAGASVGNARERLRQRTGL